MVRQSIMVVAGEPSGDLLAAELVRSLRKRLTDLDAGPTQDYQPLHGNLAPRFFGAGGPHLREAGVELAFDLTQHAVVGISDVIRKYAQFRRMFKRLYQLALEREPEAIICVDFSGFNLRFAHAIKKHARALRGTFGNWDPYLIQYVSPQVWASRPERAGVLARNVDLLLSVVPFESDWYAARVPELPVVFVGHPIVDRYPMHGPIESNQIERWPAPSGLNAPRILILPGSRRSELHHHLPVLIHALARIQAAKPNLRAQLVLPNEALAGVAREFTLPPNLDVQVGGLEKALTSADVALASTGTVTLECAFFGVPTVALYKTSWVTYWIAKSYVQVRYLGMPNLMAGEAVYPEFIQAAATAENIAGAALELLDNPARRTAIRQTLAKISRSLGAPGASERAADAILKRISTPRKPLRATLRS